MNTEPKHQYEHEQPTVIHHPDEDMTILGRWFYNGMQQGARFWLLLGGGLAALIALLFFFNTLSTGSTPAGQAWTELVVAKTPVEMVEIAETFPETPASPWAKIQAASNYYLTAGFDLPDPAKRDTALPQLKKALDLFEQVAKSAPKGSQEGLVATIGLGRTHEVRNELPEAIKAYEDVVAGWPNSAEAKEAEKLAKRLKEPEAVAFYKAFYDYKTPAATLPGGLPANHPSLNGPMIPAPALPGLGTGTGAGSAPGSGLFTPPSPTTPLDLPPPPTPPSTPAKAETPKAEMTKPEAPKVEAPKAEPKPAPKPEAPKVEAPKPAPKPETPKAEAPKPEAPKPAPKPEAPKAEMTKPAPKAEALKAEAPKPAPKPEAPKAEPPKPAESPKPAPKPEAPKAEAPKPAPKPEAPKAAEAPKPAAPKAEEKAKAAAPKGELPDDVFSKPK